MTFFDSQVQSIFKRNEENKPINFYILFKIFLGLMKIAILRRNCESRKWIQFGIVEVNATLVATAFCPMQKPLCAMHVLFIIAKKKVFDWILYVWKLSKETR